MEDDDLFGHSENKHDAKLMIAGQGFRLHKHMANGKIQHGKVDNNAHKAYR